MAIIQNICFLLALNGFFYSNSHLFKLSKNSRYHPHTIPPRAPFDSCAKSYEFRLHADFCRPFRDYPGTWLGPARTTTKEPVSNHEVLQATLRRSAEQGMEGRAPNLTTTPLATTLLSSDFNTQLSSVQCQPQVVLC